MNHALSCVCVMSALTVLAGPELTSIGVLPLTDMGTNRYLGCDGGLYEGRRNNPPDAHAWAGAGIATNVIPRDANGVPSTTGKIVLISIGMSNTSQEFDRFVQIAQNHRAKNPSLIIVNGAQGGQDAVRWTNEFGVVWTNVDMRLASAGVTSNQVQAIWLKQALASPLNYGVFSNHAVALKACIGAIARNAQRHYPNLKLMFLSSRTRAYVLSASGLNPEVYAFESGFAVRWLIADQINGSTSLNYKAANGPVAAPYLTWGPYLWVDGTNARSDGFTWPPGCVVTTDFTHPSAVGAGLVATQLLAFFKTDAAATPWFLRTTVTSQPPYCVAGAAPAQGAPPLQVQFTAAAGDPDGAIAEYMWTFDDGTFATVSNPVKRFDLPGIYDARVTVTDTSGNTTTCVVRVTVPETHALVIWLLLAQCCCHRQKVVRWRGGDDARL